MLTEEKVKSYVEILSEELVPAMGCTEPISIAFAASKARCILGKTPKKILLEVSGNLVKNAKSVTVPHTGGLKGLKAAVAAGILCGDDEAGFQVLANDISKEDIDRIVDYMDKTPIDIEIPDDAKLFDVRVTAIADNDKAYIKIQDTHINIVSIVKNGEVLFSKEDSKEEKKADKSCLNVEDIVEFANTCDLNLVKPILDRQIKYNMAIAKEGIENNYGANIGKVLLATANDDVRNLAKAYAAAASDARMSGCEMPVVINSGSGNQGITASVPVVIYAKTLNVNDEKLYRALLVSNLITLHVKNGIGTLSAYCGAVVAGAGAGCGIAYLFGGGFEEIAHTLVNALAIDSGMVCDGAKASCAAKIATAVENGILGFTMFKEGNQFYDGDGIVKKGVENTIKSVSRLARNGMIEADREILKIMLDKE